VRLLRVEPRGGGWFVRPIPHGIAPLLDDRVLVRRAGAAPAYAAGPDRWEPVPDDPGDFVPLADGTFLLRG